LKYHNNDPFPDPATSFSHLEADPTNNHNQQPDRFASGINDLMNDKSFV